MNMAVIVIGTVMSAMHSQTFLSVPATAASAVHTARGEPP